MEVPEMKSRVRALAAAALFALGAACSDEEEAPIEELPEPVAAASVEPAEIINNPASWAGKTVTVSGDVEEVWSPRAFNMDSGVTTGELLVLTKQPVPTLQDFDPLVDDVATVTGTVRMLVIGEIERELGWDLQPELETEFTGKPVLVVDTAEIRPKDPPVEGEPIADLTLIVLEPAPETLIGRAIHLENVEVQRVAGDRGFLIGPDEESAILAVLARGLNQPPLEDIVDVDANQVRSLTGIVRRAPAADEAAAELKLSPEDANALENRKIYLHVTAIELIPR